MKVGKGNKSNKSVKHVRLLSITSAKHKILKFGTIIPYFLGHSSASLPNGYAEKKNQSQNHRKDIEEEIEHHHHHLYN